MTASPIRFEDGGAYDRSMGGWSRLAGAIFLDWLAPGPGQRWIDIGCGSGAFTALLAERCAPAELAGVDPAAAQLDFARARPMPCPATFQEGDAMALPFEGARFDAATMALVIFFVPDPAKGVAEMARVVRPGGTVAAYAWDIEGGGFPFRPIQAELQSIGIPPNLPPNPTASRLDALAALWTNAHLADVETRVIAVERTFTDFEDFWTVSTAAGGIRAALGGLSPDEAAKVKDRVRARLPARAGGQITYGARANAVKGRVPG